MNQLQLTRKDLLNIFMLWTIAVIIFYPVVTSEYVYTDEIVQLWKYKKGSNFQMFLEQGRLITEKLFQWLFSSATTIQDISYIRLFSLGGWLLSIPLWYLAIKKVVEREKLPEILIFFSVLYLVCSPQFCIYVSWASCLELFLANTAGLLSGYYLYTALAEWKLNRKKAIYLGTISIIAAQVSLFTYQSGFGCFLLPFLLHLIKEGKVNRQLVIGITGYLLMYALYYLLFRLSITIAQAGTSSRTGIVIDPFGKLKFLLLKVLPSSFHFTHVINEKDKLAKIVYRVLLAAWIVINFIQQRKNTVAQRISYPFVIVLMWALIYLPSMLVKENYGSNRTLLALNMSVFFLVMHSLIIALRSEKLRTGFVYLACILFVINARNNFHKLFLRPITNEYRVVSQYIQTNYRPDIKTVYFIRPTEDFFVRKYGITRSWDELGVPSTFFDWVPPYLVKQVVFEKTGKRDLADQITIQHYLGKDEFVKAGIQPGVNELLVDVEALMAVDQNSDKPDAVK
jgi:hypothetical protein